LDEVRKKPKRTSRRKNRQKGEKNEFLGSSSGHLVDFGGLLEGSERRNLVQVAPVVPIGLRRCTEPSKAVAQNSKCISNKENGASRGGGRGVNEERKDEVKAQAVTGEEEQEQDTCCVHEDKA